MVSLLQSTVATVGIFFVSILCLWGILSTYAAYTVEVHKHGLRMPWSLDDVKELRSLFQALFHTFPIASFAAFGALYLFKQTFAIPGSFVLNIAAGAVFGTLYGTAVITVSLLFGASLCYALSLGVGGGFLSHPRARRKLTALQQHVSTERSAGHLFFYLVSLRVFPFTPNWFINLASPWAGVSWPYFASSLLIGLLPYNFVTVRAGTIVEQCKSVSDALDTSVLLQLTGIAAVMLMPAVWKRFQPKTD